MSSHVMPLYSTLSLGGWGVSKNNKTKNTEGGMETCFGVMVPGQLVVSRAKLVSCLGVSPRNFVRIVGFFFSKRLLNLGLAIILVQSFEVQMYNNIN